MMCRKRQKPKADRGESIKNKAAKKILEVIHTSQKGFARIMGKWVNGLTQRGKKTFLLLFCIAFWGYSLYIILSTFIGQDIKTEEGIKLDAISVPKHFDKSGDENTSANIFVTEHDLAKIKEFRHYMDSLKLSASGKKIYDSITLTRPGLFDSVKILEQIYFYQKQKSELWKVQQEQTNKENSY